MKTIFIFLILLILVFINFCTPTIPDPTTITDVHVVFSNHLDVGFDGIPNLGYSINVINTYFDVYFPRAITTANQMRQKHTGDRYIWLTQSWLVSLYLDCPSEFPSPLPGVTLHCPNTTQLTQFQQALRQGDIIFHAFPFNGEPELLDESLFKYAIKLGQDIADTYNTTHPRTLSQRDVPGLTMGVIDPLVEMGVDAISIGVNGASAPPAVGPGPFVWNPPQTTNKILAFVHPGGYGGVSTHDCVYTGTHALATAWRGDNAGPHTLEEAQEVFTTIRKTFPNANVFATSFDSFVDVLKDHVADLPVVTSEIGDTWIYGVASDPLKQALYRTTLQLRQACVDSGSCVDSDKRFFDFNRLLLKISEHTDGMDIKTYLHDETNWSDKAFHKLQYTASNYETVTKSWLEQRDYLTYAVKALGDHPFADVLSSAFSELQNLHLPDLTSYEKIPNFVNEKFKCGRFELSFSATGGLNHFYDGLNNHSWADPTHLLAQFTYLSYSQNDYEKFFDEYFFCPSCTWAHKDFGKPGCNVSNGCVGSKTVPKALELYRKEDSKNYYFVVRMSMEEQSYSVFGAPEEVYLQVNVSKEEGNAVQEVAFEVYLVNKTSSRIPESMWLGFSPLLNSVKGSPWSVQKINTWIDPEDVIVNGSKHLHAVNNGVYFENESDGKFVVESLDAPLVSFQVMSPFPTPLTGDLVIEQYFWCLENNIWGTNYPAFYPFVKDELLMRFRFSMPFYICEGKEC